MKKKKVKKMVAKAVEEALWNVYVGPMGPPGAVGPVGPKGDPGPPGHCPCSVTYPPLPYTNYPIVWS